jgi:hypothetical protein
LKEQLKLKAATPEDEWHDRRTGQANSSYMENVSSCTRALGAYFGTALQLVLGCENRLYGISNKTLEEMTMKMPRTDMT